jgi:hypothetical protein
MSSKQSAVLQRIKFKKENNPNYELSDWEKKFMSSIKLQAEKYIYGNEPAEDSDIAPDGEAS